MPHHVCLVINKVALLLTRANCSTVQDQQTHFQFAILTLLDRPWDNQSGRDREGSAEATGPGRGRRVGRQ